MAVLSLASIAMMTVDHRQHHMDDVRDALAYGVTAIQYLVSLPGRAGQCMAETLATRPMLVRRNATLRAQHLLL